MDWIVNFATERPECIGFLVVGFVAAVVTNKLAWWGDLAIAKRMGGLEMEVKLLKKEVVLLRSLELARLVPNNQDNKGNQDNQGNK